jgi:hypothetical protein
VELVTHLAERGEFELSVPLFKLADESLLDDFSDNRSHTKSDSGKVALGDLRAEQLTVASSASRYEPLALPWRSHDSGTVQILRMLRA